MRREDIHVQLDHYKNLSVYFWCHGMCECYDLCFLKVGVEERIDYLAEIQTRSLQFIWTFPNFVKNTTFNNGPISVNIQLSSELHITVVSTRHHFPTNVIIVRRSLRWDSRRKNIKQLDTYYYNPEFVDTYFVKVLALSNNHPGWACDSQWTNLTRWHGSKLTTPRATTDGIVLKYGVVEEPLRNTVG